MARDRVQFTIRARDDGPKKRPYGLEVSETGLRWRTSYMGGPYKYKWVAIMAAIFYGMGETHMRVIDRRVDRED